jgi:hypothetical protein
MSKKAKDPFIREVNKCFTRNREKREYKVPTAFLMSVADSLHRTNPSKEILYNVLVDVATVVSEKMYERRINDRQWFKRKQESHLEAEFKEFTDYLDDLTHCKDEIKPTFNDWQAKQVEIRKQLQSNNQSK